MSTASIKRVEGKKAEKAEKAEVAEKAGQTTDYLERLAKLKKVRDALPSSDKTVAEKEKELAILKCHICDVKAQALLDLFSRQQIRWQSVLDVQRIELILKHVAGEELRQCISEILEEGDECPFTLVPGKLFLKSCGCDIELLVQSTFNDPISLLTPIKDNALRVDTEGLYLAMRKLRSSIGEIEKLASHLKSPALAKYHLLISQRDKLSAEIVELRGKLSGARAEVGQQVAEVIFSEKLLQAVTWKTGVEAEKYGVFMLKHPLCRELNMLHNLMAWDQSNVIGAEDDGIPSIRLDDGVDVTQFVPIPTERQVKAMAKEMEKRQAKAGEDASDTLPVLPSQVIINFRMPRKQAIELLEKWGVKWEDDAGDKDI